MPAIFLRNAQRPSSPTSTTPDKARPDSVDNANEPFAALLTPNQAAAQLGVTRKVLERWRGTGAPLRYVRLSSKTIRYQRRDIEAFVAESTRMNTAQS